MTSVSMAMPMTTVIPGQKAGGVFRNEFLFVPLLKNPSFSQKKSTSISSSRRIQFQVHASLKEKAVVAATVAAQTAVMMVPQVAEAAEVSPSLKNFLYSIIAGGVVLAAIGGAVVGVSYFDPVKRT